MTVRARLACDDDARTGARPGMNAARLLPGTFGTQPLCWGNAGGCAQAPMRHVWSAPPVPAIIRIAAVTSCFLDDRPETARRVADSVSEVRDRQGRSNAARAKQRMEWNIESPKESVVFHRKDKLFAIYHRVNIPHGTSCAALDTPLESCK